MNNLKSIIIGSFFLIRIFGCKGEDQISPIQFECGYQELKNKELKKITENGHHIGGELKIILENNMKKLGNGEFKFEINDSSIIDSEIRIEKIKTYYKTNFLNKHNAIIQILCAIDKDLQDTTISINERELFFKEKIKRRGQYFDLLIDQHPIDKKNNVDSDKKEYPIPNVNTDDRRKNKNIEKNKLSKRESVNYFIATGTCFIDKNYPDRKAVLMAKKCAQIVAKTELLELINGSEIISKASIRDYTMVQNNIESLVSGLIKNTEDISEIIEEDHVTIKLAVLKKDVLRINN